MMACCSCPYLFGIATWQALRTPHTAAAQTWGNPATPPTPQKLIPREQFIYRLPLKRTAGV